MTLESESLKNISKNVGQLLIEYGITPYWTICYAAPKILANITSVRKTASFSEFSLCLSRAFLGKMFVFMYKWLKNAVLRRTRQTLQPSSGGPRRRREYCCAVCYVATRPS